MARLRKVVFWAHLITALVVGLVVLIMSVTGVLLTYERQMTWWADTRGLDASRPDPTSARLDTDALLASVGPAVDGEPTAVTWRADPDDPASVALGRGRTVYVNAYTGEVLGEGSERMRAFFRYNTDWHRWLAQAGEGRALGRAITGASNMAFLFIVLSGFYLWWPRNWSGKAVRNVTVFRGGLSGKARDFNWHNVIGFWSALPLAVVVASAVVISYPWASNLAYRIVGDTPPTAGGGRGDPLQVGGPGPELGVAPEPVAGGALAMALLEDRAEDHVPGWRSIIRQVTDDERSVTFTIDAGNGGQPQKRAQLTLDTATGEVVRWEPFSSGTPGRRLRSILRFAHTGEVAGPIGQTVAGFVSLGAVFLVWTGFALTLRRFLAWRGRRGVSLPLPPRQAGRGRKEMVGSA